MCKLFDCGCCSDEDCTKEECGVDFKLIGIITAVIAVIAFAAGIAAAITVSSKINAVKAKRAAKSADFDADEYVRSLNLDN